MKYRWIAYVLLFLLVMVAMACASKKKDTNQSNQVDQRLHDIWVVDKIYGESLPNNVEHPRLEIYVADKRILGFDGCSDIEGAFKTEGDDNFQLQLISEESNGCDENGMSIVFRSAIVRVKSYQLHPPKLYLLDSEGNVALELHKVD